MAEEKFPVEKSDAEWRRELAPEEYQVTRCSATEPPFTGRYWNHHERGVYRCVACGAPLFGSDAKFDSGTGWPSFFQPLPAAEILAATDLSHGMRRIEARCRRCGSHLGHIFPDGPPPTGQRYCINSAALRFEPEAR